jgi:hypothetical protein
MPTDDRDAGRPCIGEPFAITSNSRCWAPAPSIGPPLLRVNGMASVAGAWSAAAAVASRQ